MKAEMHTVRSQFDSLLDRLHNGEAAAASKLQDLRVLMDAKSYRGLLSEGFAARQAAEGVRLAELFDVRDLAQMLLETFLESKERAIAIGSKLALSDARFDAALLECLREVSAGSSDDALLAGLEILDAISERDRLVLNVLRLLKHENPKLRSKAASFIAKRRPYLRWVTDLSQEPDARVRANTLESLVGINEPFIAPLFRQHVNDENNRVAGNAVLGLYQLGDTASIRHLDEMARDERPQFRNTAVWVMGQTGDPRFSSALAAQLSDTDKLVRRQALLGLGKIKRAFKTTRERNPLHVRVLGHFVQNGREFLTPAVSSAGEALRAIPGTRFLVKAGSCFVRDYNAQEYVCNTPLNTAFIDCVPKHEEHAVSAQLGDAISRLLELRRQKDKLVSCQLGPEAQTMCCQCEPGELEGTLSVALSGVDLSTPNLQCILLGTSHDKAIANRILDWAASVNATIHVIAIAPEWRSAELRERVNIARGHVIAAEPHEAGQACLEMHAALLHHYRLDWPVAAGDLELQVRADTGTGLAVFSKGTLSSAASTAADAVSDLPA